MKPIGLVLPEPETNPVIKSSGKVLDEYVFIDGPYPKKSGWRKIKVPMPKEIGNNAYHSFCYISNINYEDRTIEFCWYYSE